MQSKGFTIIELVVYLGLFILVATFITLFSLVFLREQRDLIISGNLTSAVIESLNLISYEIRNAEEVYSPTSVFNQDNSQLSLKTKKNLPTGETYTYVDFYLSGNKLFIKRESEEAMVLNPADINISRFFVENIFSTSTIESLRINITAEATSSFGGILRYSATTTAEIR